MSVNLIPRPARDMSMVPLLMPTLKQLSDKAWQEPNDPQTWVNLNKFMQKEADPAVEKTFKAVSRTALAILGSLVLYKIGVSASSLAISATLGAAISLPAVAIAGGSWLAYQGIAAIAASVTSSSFATLGYGAAALLGGWIALERHDVIPFGLGEMAIHSAANSLAPSLVKSLT